MNAISPNTTFGIANIVIPPEGPKCVPLRLDFSVQTSIEISGELITAQGHIEYVQGLYIDNADNDDPVTLTIGTTNQRIIAAPNSQGYYAVLFVNPPTLTVETTAVADKKVRLHFYNVPIQAQQWGSADAGGALTDTQLRATPVPVSGPLTDAELRATAVPVTSSQPIGGAYTNRSIANLSGASEQLMAANANRKVLIVSNEGATAVAINVVGGVAALNTAGNITIAAGGNIVLDTFPPTGAINIIGTLNADVSAFEA